jgi:pyruvate dehydrogenase E2 component (dihydrolipoamide acetyltransferase)
LPTISKEIKELAELTRAGKLAPEALNGGTFTITNLGMYNIESFTPIINQPQVAILGVNKMTDTPVVINGEITVRPLMKFSLTFDHRAVDGSVAAEFMNTLKKFMEAPILML